MRKAVKIILGVSLLVAIIVGLVFHRQGAKTRAALAAYKTSLRSSGEKLTWAELGFPMTPCPGQAVDQLVAGVNHLGPAKFAPGLLDLIKFTAPGRAQVLWAMAQPPLGNNWDGKKNALTWLAFTEELERSADALAELRGALKNPPRYFSYDPVEMLSLNGVRPPLVELRTAAQWLAGDAVVAIHEGQHSRAREDLHALTQLVQLHRDDMSFVSQMMRVALSGVGLAATWEALQSPDWSEDYLAAWQRDWEAVDLFGGVENGLVAERALGESFFESARNRVGGQNAYPFVPLPGNSKRTVRDLFNESVIAPYWRANMDVDELFYLRHFQTTLDGLRKVQHGTPWWTVDRELQASQSALDALLAHPIKKYRYLISGIAIPNTGRISNTVIRNETQRRLAVIAIALERLRLRDGRLSPDLNALVPRFLSAVPIDPMSAKPLRYRLNADGSFTLYSVGEDGRDDGGDPNAGSVTNRFGLWEGKDAVWPAAAK